MLLILLVLLVVVPLAELWAIIAVSDVIGGWPTIALLLFDSLLGAWLLKRQGKGVMEPETSSIDQDGPGTSPKRRRYCWLPASRTSQDGSWLRQ